MKHILDFNPVTEEKELYSAMNGHKYRDIVNIIEIGLIELRKENKTIKPEQMIGIVKDLRLKFEVKT